MIKQETYIDEQGNRHENLIKTYSDKNLMIKQVETGAEYSEAVDVSPVRFTYVETDKEIEKKENAE